MQSVKLLILFTIWLVALAAFSFLVLPYRGELFGVSIALVYLTLIYFLMDKWILLFLLSSKVKRGDEALEKFNNISYAQNMRGISLYYSRLDLGNILALDWAGKKIVILDRQSRNSEDLDHRFKDVIGSFETGLARKRSWLTFLFCIYNLPLVFLEKVFKRVWLYNLFVTIWLTPFQLISEKAELDKDKNETFEQAHFDGNNFDTFTTVTVQIMGIYKSYRKDLVNMVFNRECF